MLLTTESTAWAVTFSAGTTIGVILGHGFTPQSLAVVVAIATLASCVCYALLERIRLR